MGPPPGTGGSGDGSGGSGDGSGGSSGSSGDGGGSGGRPTSPDRVVVGNSVDAVTAYDTPGCTGREIRLSSVHDNTLCGTHWTDPATGLAAGTGSCTAAGSSPSPSSASTSTCA